jgi:hypothetical protein
MQHVAKITQGLKDKVTKKKFYAINLGFLLFKKKPTWFYIMISLKWLYGFDVEAFDSFWENLQVL